MVNNRRLMGYEMSKSVDGRLPVFQERFNELRGDISQDKFAKKVGVSKATVGFYENGSRLPDIAKLREIATKCGVSADWLLGLTNIKAPNADAQAVESKTGLSGRAIAILERHKEYKDGLLQQGIDSYEITDFINAMLETPEFHTFIEDIATTLAMGWHSGGLSNEEIKKMDMQLFTVQQAARRLLDALSERDW